MRKVSAAQLSVAPAAERNKQPILDVLTQYIPTSSDTPLEALEIASGTGQHVVHFAQHFRNVTWQPCEYDKRSLHSIEDHIAYSGLSNVRVPLYVDASLPVEQWGDGCLTLHSYDIIYSANMMHISPWRVSTGFIEGSGKLLKSCGLLFVYGPFGLDGTLEPESNINFDKSLRSRDPEWGIRDRRVVENLAKQNGLHLQTVVEIGLETD